MTRSGGPSTAAGVSYQALAIALKAIDVHRGEILSLRAEVPPAADFGGSIFAPTVDDFVVEKPAERIYTQAKTSAPGGGNWTLSKLLRESILQDFFAQARNDASAKCHLLSPSPCPLLGDIAELARSSKSLPEFKGNLNLLQAKEFSEVCAVAELATTEAEAYEFLKRFFILNFSREALLDALERATALLFADPIGAQESLFALAARWMCTSREVTQETLDEDFRVRAVFRRPKETPLELSERLRAATARLAESSIAINNVHILQPAVGKVFQWAISPPFNGKSLAAFLDQAGSGKSVAMTVLCEKLRLAGYEVLGLRLDGLQFSNAEELQRCLALPGPIPSILQVLRNDNRKVALLIDQLDALAIAYSNRSEAVTTIMDLMAQVALLKDIPTIVASRSFDWNYSHLLREIRDKAAFKETLPELTDVQVAAVLSAFGIDAGRFHHETRQVVRTPYRLKLLIEIILERRRTESAWLPSRGDTLSLQSLLEQFWQIKLSAAAAEDGLEEACVDVVRRVAAYLAENETLTAPRALLDSRKKAADWLISAGVLSASDNGVAFFHQTFFDFIVARQFTGDNESVTRFLLDTDQGLFYRPLTRQILAHLRGADRKRYLREVGELLSAGEIRQHLKWLVIADIGQSPMPTPDEFALLKLDYLSEENFWRTTRYWGGNPGWLDLLGPAFMREWLRSTNQMMSRATLNYLASIFSARQAEVIALLSPYVGTDAEWNHRVSLCMTGLGESWSASSIELLKLIFANGQSDLDQEFGAFWTAFGDLARHFPERACELLPTILERFSDRWSVVRDVSRDESKLLLPKAHEFQMALKVLSQKCPKQFIEIVLPWIIDKMELSCTERSPALYRFSYKHWNIDRETRRDVAAQLLSSVSFGIRTLAKEDPDEWEGLASALSRTDIAPLHSIVAKGYAENPERFAFRAAEYLSGDPRRLRLGTIQDHLAHSMHLISRCRSYWTPDQASLVEAGILSLPQVSRPTMVEELRRAGRSKLRLLTSLGDALLSAQGKRIYGELRRKFPEVTRIGGYSRVGVVGSPIPAENLKKLGDLDWRAAMLEFAGEDAPFSRKFPLRGGRTELASVLKQHAKDDPGRFSRLAFHQMDSAIHADYHIAVLAGIAEANVPMAEIAALARRIIPFLAPEHHHRIASILTARPVVDIPADLVAQIREWALHSPNPEDPRGRTIWGGGNRRRRDELLTEGINNTRGSCVWAFAKICLESTPRRDTEFLDFAALVANDPAPSVRAVCLRFLSYSIPADYPKGFSIFLRLIEGFPELLAESEAQDCICRCLPRNAEQLLPIISDLLKSDDMETREAGARLACLASFASPKAGLLRDSCLTGPVELRRGAAEVYSTNALDATVGEESRNRLAPLLDDPEDSVRSKAVGFLRKLDNWALAVHEDLIRIWLRSKALSEGADNVSHPLSKHPLANPMLTLEVGEMLVKVLGRDLVDIRQRHGIILYHLTPALLNVYRHSPDFSVRKQALDLFEKFEALGSPEVNKAYESFDRS